jgi:hypothetical protein
MSRALRINTVIEVDSTFDTNAINLAKSVMEKLQTIANETPSEGVLSELKRAEERYNNEVAEKITWLIGILPSSIYKAASRLKVKPLSTDAQKVEIVSGADEMITNLVQVGLKGFKNFNDADGKPIEFRTVKGNIGGEQLDIVDPAILNVIPWEHQIDIGNQVRLANSVGATNQKN